MKSEKVQRFMKLAGVSNIEELSECPPKLRLLGAQLLLSETLEYVIKGLGVTPVVNGQAISEPDGLDYTLSETKEPNRMEMLDGLADVAYTMFWNAVAFSLPLEEAYELVCDNNLEKFVPLDDVESDCSPEIAEQDWDCGSEVSWPKEVVKVSRLKVQGQWYAVGTDENGKVRKPSTYSSVNLQPLATQVRR